MTLNASNDRRQPLPLVASAGILHLLLLCAPVALVGGGGHVAESPRILVFLSVASVWYFVESMASAGESRLPMRCHGPQRLPLAIGLLLLATFWVSLADAAASLTAAFDTAAVAGALLMAMGIALRYLSLRTLGHFFLNEVALMPGQPLVTGGIYGRLRHPSETGTLCLAVGGALVLGSVYGLTVGTLLLLPCVIWRTRLEDRMLRNHYTREFIGYAKEVRAFLPRLRRTRLWRA